MVVRESMYNTDMRVTSLQGDSKSNQPGGGTAPSQIGLFFCVLIGSCMRTKKNQFFLCQLRSMINLRPFKKIGLISEIGCATPLL